MLSNGLNGLKLLKNGFENGFKCSQVVQKWFRICQNWFQNWFKNGFENGSKVIPKYSQMV